VGLDYYPDTPVKLTGVDPDYCEIPTIPTALAQVQDQMKKIMTELEQLPLKQIVESAARTIDGVDKLVSSPEVRRALTSADVTLSEARRLIANLNSKVDPAVISLVRTLDVAQQTMDGVGRDVRRLVEDVDTRVGPLATNLGATSDSARVLLQDAQRTLHRLDEQIGPTMTALRQAADAAHDAMRRAETALGQVDGVLDGNSPLGYELAQALEELARTAASLRVLSEAVDRQPNLLLFGRGGPRN
jgi:paraquat-inducible protein B